ncbi:MAG: S1 RNA-binding domain-containing protein [Comamonadaceae bacterium]|nr:S1 RNA-binding domain-containing protein [Comamonadaceae bacterium]
MLEVAVGDRIQAMVVSTDGRPDALAEAGARRRHRAAARRRVPRRPAGGRQGREGGEGRLRGAHRPPARLLPVLPDRHRSATRRRRTTKGTSTRSASSSTGKAAGTSSSRGGRCSKRSSRPRAAEIRQSIVPGAVLTGRVASVRDFGAFVDLGAGVQGLLHVSEMGWSRVSDAVAGRHARPGDHRQGAARRRGHAEDRPRAEAARRRSVVDGPRRVRGGPGARGPRHAPRGVRRVRRAGARRRRRWRMRPRSRRPGGSGGWSTIGRRRA